MFAKDMKIAELIDVYGELLSEHRREIIEAYYFEDLSLSEISERISESAGISRQGVRDSIKKSEAQLREFEEKLGLCEKNAAFENAKTELAGRIKSVADSLSPLGTVPDAETLAEIAGIADEIAGELKELNFLG